MNVITRKRIREFIALHPDAGTALEQWYRVARRAQWQSIRDVRIIFPTADAAIVKSGNTVTVFNIGGNKYRLVTAIHYNAQRVYVLRFLTHAAYEKDLWKDQL